MMKFVTKDGCMLLCAEPDPALFIETPVEDDVVAVLADPSEDTPTATPAPAVSLLGR